MSEQENTQLVRSMFEAFQKGDVPGVLDTLTEDVEWRLAGPTEVTYAGIRRGRDQVAEVFKVLGETSEFEQFELHDYIAQGDKVVVLGHERQRVKATGQVVETEWAMVFGLHQGKVARFHNYVDTHAVAAAHRGP